MTPREAFDAFDTALKEGRPPILPTDVPPSAFICAPPRSGSTLLYQALAYQGEVGFIDNLSARFAGDPPLGALLSRALAAPKVFTGHSNFGRTDHITEPHEFGLGWERLLGGVGVAEPDPPVALTAEAVHRIETLLRAFDRPTVFKSFAYLWHASALAEALPKSVWIRLLRPIAETARSLEALYEARRATATNAPWQSAVCAATRRGVTCLTIDERTRRQIEDLDRHIARQFDMIAPERQIAITFDDLVSDPLGTASSLLQQFGFPLDPQALEKTS